jgi:hypothetical protein
MSASVAAVGRERKGNFSRWISIQWMPTRAVVQPQMMQLRSLPDLSLVVVRGPTCRTNDPGHSNLIWIKAELCRASLTKRPSLSRLSSIKIEYLALALQTIAIYAMELVSHDKDSNFSFQDHCYF